MELELELELVRWNWCGIGIGIGIEKTELTPALTGTHLIMITVSVSVKYSNNLDTPYLYQWNRPHLDIHFSHPHVPSCTTALLSCTVNPAPLAVGRQPDPTQLH